jgi:hypothetical protein
MKKHIIVMLIFLFWASSAAAQTAGGAREPESQEQVFNGLVGPTYNWVSLDRSPRAGEYQFLESSFGGVLQTEWDPLPQRFSLDTNYLNRKDYFGEMDYAYRDVVVVNLLTRGMFHNLDHLSLGVDDPTTPSPSFTDLNPGDRYGIESQLRKAFIRFKTPDFPFHLYAEAVTTDREGKIQQLFLRGFTGGLDKVSQTRDIDWNSQEVRVGLNSHLGPLEADYSHSEKKFQSLSDKALFDIYPLFAVPHNEVPELKSSSDTVKLHTSYTGKIVAAVTYSSGDKKNVDSSAKADFRNAAGDLTITPAAGLLLVLKYRHYDLSLSDPDTVTLPGVGSTFNVRAPISSTRDVMSGAVRYRVTDRVTVRGEYAVALTVRDAAHGADFTPLQIAPTQTGTGPNTWDVAHRTLKSTEKLGLSYRFTNKLALRADIAAAQVTDPAYADDPDRINSGKATVTWSPGSRVIALASYGGVREQRDNLAAPLAGGSRKADRDQALGSVTLLVGKRSSVTASYLYFKNKTSESLTFTDLAGAFSVEDRVPYGDKAQVFSLAASQSVGEGATLTAEASKSYSSGSFRIDGSVPNTSGIDAFSDLRVVEDIYTAGLELQISRNVGSELRYQHRHFDDKIDNAQDGRVDTALAALHVRW